MIEYLGELYSPILYFTIAILIFLCYYIGSTKKFLYLLIPLIVIITITAVSNNYIAMTKPIIGFPPSERAFYYNHHKTEFDRGKISIVLWLTDQKYHRNFLYIFPHTKETQRNLKRLKDGMDGKPVKTGETLKFKRRRAAKEIFLEPISIINKAVKIRKRQPIKRFAR